MQDIILSIVLGTYNRKDFLLKTIDSVRAEIDRLNLRCEVIVIDGGSEDGTINWLTHQKDIISIIQHNRGSWEGQEIERKSWGYFMNLGFRNARGKFVCMISDDCLLVPGCLTNGVELFQKKLDGGFNLGALAFYWRNWPVDQQYFVGLTVGRRMFVNHGLYLSDALKAVDFADEKNFSFYHADGDLVLKMWEKGYICEDSPESFVEHYADANTKVRKSNYQRQKDDWKYYLSKWADYLEESNGFEGGWVYKDFNDSTRTGDQFLSLYKRDMLIKKADKVQKKVRSGIKKILGVSLSKK